MGAHPLLEVSDRVEVEVAGGDVGRGRAGCAARDPLVHLAPDQAEGLEALGRELHVLVLVVVDVELLAFACRVQHRDADHGNLPPVVVHSGLDQWTNVAATRLERKKYGIQTAALIAERPTCR